MPTEGVTALLAQHPALARGQCACCGAHAGFKADDKPLRENLSCRACGATLRYRKQAEAILSVYGRTDDYLAELVRDPAFRETAVYEPGTLGPFRALFRELPNYTTSVFASDMPLGASSGGARVEDLQALTFDDASFDLIITSDIFEHVRRPVDGFSEVFRVLRPGGRHVFTVPMGWPLPPTSVARIDTNGTEDIYLLEPVYHGAGRSLVYTDFGMDLPHQLWELGFRVSVVHGFRNAVTFIAERPRSSELQLRFQPDRGTGPASSARQR